MPKQMSFDIMNNILLNYGLSKENLKKGGKRGGFLGKEIRKLVKVGKLGQKGGNGNSNSQNIIKSFSSDLDEFKYKWFQNSCWIDAPLINLLGIGETDLTKNIREKCKSNDDDFCKFINNFMASVNKDYRGNDLEMNVTNKMIFYNKLKEISKTKYSNSDFKTVYSYGSASSIYDLLLSYGDISYNINITGKFDVNNITEQDVNNITNNDNLTFTINNNKIIYEVKNKIETIHLTEDSYNDLFSKNPKIPFKNYYQQIKGFDKATGATQIELEKFIFKKTGEKLNGFVKKSIFDGNEQKILDEWYSRNIDHSVRSEDNKNSTENNFNNFSTENGVLSSYTLKIQYIEKYEFDVPNDVLDKIELNKFINKNINIKKSKDVNDIKKINNLFKFYKEYGEIFKYLDYYDANGTITIDKKGKNPWLTVIYNNLKDKKNINAYISENLSSNDNDILVLAVDSFYDKNYWNDENYKIIDEEKEEKYKLKSATITTEGGSHYLSLIEYKNKWYVIDVMRKTITEIQISELKDRLNKAIFLIYKKATAAKKATAIESKPEVPTSPLLPSSKKKEKITFNVEAENPLPEAIKTFEKIKENFGPKISIETIDNNNLKDMEESKKELKEITEKLIEYTKQIKEGISNFNSDYEQETKRKIVREIKDKEDIISKKMKEITDLFNKLF